MGRPAGIAGRENNADAATLSPHKTQEAAGCSGGFIGAYNRGDWIRTSDLLDPNQAL